MSASKSVFKEVLKIGNLYGKKFILSDIFRLMYLSHGWNLAINNEKLISDNCFYAYKNGPTIPDIYHKFKYFVTNPIPFNHSIIQGLEDLNHKLHSDMINQVIEAYTKIPKEEFRLCCIFDNSPWHKAWNSEDNKEGLIDNIEIQKYFSNQLKILT